MGVHSIQPPGIVLNPGEQVALHVEGISDTATVYMTIEWYEDPET